VIRRATRLLREVRARYARAGLSGNLHLLRRALRLSVAGARTTARTGREPRVIVSLTTLPSRIARIGPVLRSLLDQDEPADEIRLHLPSSSRREGTPYSIPDFLRGVIGLSVVHCDRDWGPATKLLPVLQAERESNVVIIAADDDVIYPPDFVANLLRWQQARPGCALGLRGWSLPPSLDWRETQTRYGTEVTEPQRVDVITGTWGMLVEPRFFDAAVLDYSGFPADAFFVDDIWLNGHLARRAVPRLLVPCRLAPLPTPIGWINGLTYAENADGGRNNRVIEAFRDAWSAPP